jgi:hypothetical protein
LTLNKCALGPNLQRAQTQSWAFAYPGSCSDSLQPRRNNIRIGLFDDSLQSGPDVALAFRKQAKRVRVPIDTGASGLGCGAQEVTLCDSPSQNHARRTRASQLFGGNQAAFRGAVRTRPDEFAEVWPEINEQLRTNPALEAKTLFEGPEAAVP